MSAPKLTPAQQQYMNIKQQHQDCLLLFRMGDFYELFYDDAKIAHQVLDITLTARDKDGPNPVPMAGIPYHALDKYLPKFMQAGYKVAIAEQMSEAIPGKVVQREVTAIMTPGTFVEHGNQQNNLVAVWRGGVPGAFHVAWGDISLGSYYTKTLSSPVELIEHLHSIQAKEVVLSPDIPEKQALYDHLHTHMHIPISRHEAPRNVDTSLAHMLQVEHLGGYGEALTEGRKQAAGVLFGYIMNIQPYALNTIHRIKYDLPHGQVFLDATTIRNLELFASSYQGNKKYSLYEVVNCTHTAMGARLLMDRMLRPTNIQVELERRLGHIAAYTEQEHEAQHICLTLAALPDLPRLLANLLGRKSTAMKRWQLRSALATCMYTSEIKKGLEKFGASKDMIVTIEKRAQLLGDALQDEVSDERLNYIRDGYDSEIDELRRLAYHADDLLLQYQQELVRHTGISNVKLKYVQNQGYLIEVTPKDIAVFEAARQEENPKFDLIRRQTLKGGERYTSTYLTELEGKIFEATQALEHKEAAHLQRLQEKLTKEYMFFAQLSEVLAEMDLSTSMSRYVKKNRWVCPTFTADNNLDIKEGRHPVIERFLPHDQQFVPNDLAMPDGHLVHIVTGPNMGGKSTYLRQQALIILLAHAGMYVPATEASMPLVDGIFARVGSGDMLAQQQSTFMTEMLEVAHILHHATSRSFVILDELGRGTSTYDGIALAQAILVYLCQQIKAKCLFATHYHELIALSDQLEGVKNFSVSVYETDTEVVFLKKVGAGGANKSYGIDVAKLAGLPSVIIAEAKENLHTLEKSRYDAMHIQSHALGFDFSFADQEKINNQESEDTKQLAAAKEFLQRIDVNKLAPIDALIKLVEIKRLLGL